MKTIKLIFSSFFFLTIFCSTSQAQDTIYYKSRKIIKEIVKWQDGLVVGERKLYDRRGNLAEEHIFDGRSAEGVLKTYRRRDHSVSSVVPVRQELKEINGEPAYVLTIQANKEVFGYHKPIRKDDKDTSFRYIIREPLILPEKNYTENNRYYNDFELYTQVIEGLTTTVIYFDREGNRTGELILNDGLKDLIKETYPGGQVKEEGRKDEQGKKIGKWLYYYPTGVLKKEETYFDGKVSTSYIDVGQNIGYENRFFDDGELQMQMRHPLPGEDNEKRIDTIWVYYDNRNVNVHLDTADHFLFFMARPGKQGDSVVYIGETPYHPYRHSMKYTEYYPDGKLKVVGYLTKPAREHYDIEKEYFQNPDLMMGPKKIGPWYYFDEQGQIVKIVRYFNLTGIIKEKDQPSDRELRKINQEYQENKEKFDFKFYDALGG